MTIGDCVRVAMLIGRRLNCPTNYCMKIQLNPSIYLDNIFPKRHDPTLAFLDLAFSEGRYKSRDLPSGSLFSSCARTDKGYNVSEHIFKFRHTVVAMVKK